MKKSALGVRMSLVKQTSVLEQGVNFVSFSNFKHFTCFPQGFHHRRCLLADAAHLLHLSPRVLLQGLVSTLPAEAQQRTSYLTRSALCPNFLQQSSAKTSPMLIVPDCSCRKTQ